MKKSIMPALNLTLAITIAGCGKEQEATPTDNAKPAMETASTAAETRHGKGIGTVTAIDATAGQITLDHGAIPELKWPAMEMAFGVTPALLGGVKVGDRVSFEIDWDGRAGALKKLDKVP